MNTLNAESATDGLATFEIETCGVFWEDADGNSVRCGDLTIPAKKPSALSQVELESLRDFKL